MKEKGHERKINNETFNGYVHDWIMLSCLLK